MSNEQILAAINAGGDRKQLMLSLWQQNQGFVYRIIRNYRRLSEWDDLQQAGYLGLDAAVRHYNPAAGVLFITYAGFWIRQAVQRQIDDTASTIRIPVRQRQKLLAYKRDVEALTALLKRTPTLEDISDYTGLTPEQIAELEADSGTSQTQSLDAPIPGTEDLTLADSVQDTQNGPEDAEARLYDEQLKAELWGIVDALPDKQPDIIKAKYIDGATVEQAAERAGITKQEGRRQEERAMRALRRGKARRKLLPYWEELEGAAMKGVGYEHFNRTWTSATEREALHLC